MSLTYRDRNIYSQFSNSDTTQPQDSDNLDLESLDLNPLIPDHEKASFENDDSHHDHHQYHCELENGQKTSFSEHDASATRCLKFRLRRSKVVLPAIFILVVALIGMLAWSCVNGILVLEVNLMRRDTPNPNTSTQTSVVASIGVGIGLLLLVLVSWALFKNRNRRNNAALQNAVPPQKPEVPQMSQGGHSLPGLAPPGMDHSDALNLVSKLL